MERAISSSAWEVNCSEVPLGVHQAQRWGVVEMCSLWGVCCLSFTPPREPGQCTKPGQNHWLRFLPRVIFVTQVLWASGGAWAQGGCQGSSWGWQLPLHGEAGLWGDGSISAGADPWAHPPFILPRCWWCDWSWETGNGEQVTLPWWARRVPALCTANFRDWK